MSEALNLIGWNDPVDKRMAMDKAKKANDKVWANMPAELLKLMEEETDEVQND